VCNVSVHLQQIVCPNFVSYNQDGLVSVRETHYYGLSWSFTFQQAPRNELFSTFRSPGMHHYAVRSGRYSCQRVLKVRSTLSSLLTVNFNNFKWRSANSKRITIRRVPLSLRYTNHSACTAESQSRNLVFPGESLLFCCFFATQTSFRKLQVTLMLRVPEHFSLMRGRAGREALS
jgi:hypothetical protein